MLENIPRPSESGASTQKTASNKSRTPPRPARSARMQFEALEPRAMMAGLGDALPAASSEFLQASLMSAFFEQSALYSAMQPTTFPTVTWINHLEQAPMEIGRADPIERIERTNDLIDMELRDESRDLGPLVLPRGMGARAAGGILRLTRTEFGWPAHVFAPYVDLSASPTFDFVDTAESEGILYFNLAHLTADAQHRPCWGGNSARGIDGGAFDAALREQIVKLRALGGDVAVSFAGPHGTPLAEAITSAGDLQSAYRDVVDAYGLRRIDFDLSGASLDDQAVIARRWQAVGALQRELAELGTPLEVWVTLPAARSGLSDAALDVVRSAGEHGVRLDGVNLRAADGGHEANPKADSRLGRLRIESTINAYYQLRQVVPTDAETGTVWTKIGITPAINRGGATGETFRPKDAQEVYGFAAQQGIGMLSLWSLNGAGPGTDQPTADGQSPAGAEPRESRAEQDAIDVSKVFRAFTEPLPK
jgi:hypothetical protein